ncbi:MAG TPA: hypothetical protein VMV07_24430 [Streptosporangiaceae bacterium]|nr:hypothetical protein [Streptosporangiaceae bacterium]
MAAESPAPTASGGPRGPLLMSMTEIAELAQVKRPVVTTWRRRYPDFPKPADGDATSPLFDSRQVAEWLIGTGRDPAGRIEADLRLHALAGLGTGLPPSDLLALLTALICLRDQDGEPAAAAHGDLRGDLLRRAARLDPRDSCLCSEIALLPAEASPLAEAVDELVEAAWGCRGAFERVMGAGQRFKAGGLYARTVAPGLARLVADLSGAREHARERTVTVRDPAAGPGDLLAAVADAAGPDYQLIFQAAEADRYLARLAGRRLAVHGVAWADLKLATGEQPPEDWADPDVIVTQVPYLPGETRSPEQVIDRLDDIALRLAPGCTAVVLGPAAVLAGELRPFSPAERTRGRLLSSGMVEAIIRLPGGLVPFRPGYDVALWVLTSAYQSPYRGWVLLADVSDRALTDEVIAALAEDVVTWRRDGYRPQAHTRAFGVQVRIGDLVDALRPLTARRPARGSAAVTAGAALVSRVTDLEAELDRLAAGHPAARPPIRGGIAAGARTPPPAQAIGSLVKARRLVLVPGSRLRGVPIGQDGHHDVLGVPEVLGRIRRGDRSIDRVVLAGLPRVRLTEPGDVVVTTTPEFGVLVDHAGLAVVEFPAKVLRIPAAERQSFTPRTLAGLLAGRMPSLRPAGAVRPPRRLEDHELPALSPAEVQFLDQLLAALDARQEAARQELDLVAELRDITTSGLSDGTLTLTEPPSARNGQ